MDETRQVIQEFNVLSFDETFEHVIPREAQVISVGYSFTRGASFWVRSPTPESSREMGVYKFRAVYTNDPLPEEIANDPFGYWRFHGTIVMRDYVIHLFGHRCPGVVKES